MSQEDSWPARRDGAGPLGPGSVLGDYELMRTLDQGGMAQVFEARHRTQQQRVALKVLSEVHGGRSVELVRRFKQEADNAARINHPHVVQVFQVGAAQGTPFLVMELLEGEELSALLKRVGHLSAEAAADLLVPVCCALAAGHDAGVVHRDLKPQNIFLSRTRSGAVVPKVVHFGAAKLNETVVLARTMSDAIVGIPFYLSPEQTMESERVDARSDQFSFGAILYECITGRRPFDSRSLFTVLTSIVHLRQAAMGSDAMPVDPELEALVERTLEKKPDARFASMREVGRALLRFASPRVQAAYVAELGAGPSQGRSSASAIPVSARESRVASPQSGRVEIPRSGSPGGSRSANSIGSASSSVRPFVAQSERHDRTERAQAIKRPTLALAWGTAAVVALAGGAWRFLGADHDAYAPPPPPPAPKSEGAAGPAQGAAPGDWDELEAGAPVAPGTSDEPADPNRFAVFIDVVPESGTFLLDGVYAGTGKTALSLPRDGQLHKLQVLAKGYRTVELAFRDEAPEPHVVLQPVNAAEERVQHGR